MFYHSMLCNTSGIELVAMAPEKLLMSFSLRQVLQVNTVPHATLLIVQSS